MRIIVFNRQPVFLLYINGPSDIILFDFCGKTYSFRVSVFQISEDQNKKGKKLKASRLFSMYIPNSMSYFILSLSVLTDNRILY
jgi:hypothetical protein